MKITSEMGPWAPIPKWVAVQAGTTALKVYVLMACMADRESGDCWPKRKTLAEQVGCNERTVTRAIAELVEIGALRSEPRFVDGTQISNLYVILVSPPLDTDVQGSLVTGVQPPLDRDVQPENHNHMEPEPGEPDNAQSVKIVVRDSSFDDFWNLYPRRVGKRSAAKAWKDATKRASAPEILMGLTRQLFDLCRRETQYVPHPATWLNRDGWLDEPDDVAENIRRAVTTMESAEAMGLNPCEFQFDQPQRAIEGRREGR